MTTRGKALPGRAGRLRIYILEMYPPAVTVPYSFMLFFGYYFLLEALYGLAILDVSVKALLGAVTLAAFTLLLRVFDEFKDYELDCKLFPERPLPSGRVTKDDLKALGWSLAVLMVLLNLPLGFGFVGFLGLMAYGLLMLKYFFLPRQHARSLLLTLATHNPIAAVTHLYILAVFVAIHSEMARPVPVGAWLGIVMFWSLVFAWETARKIRAAEEETDYVTYSRIFGPRLAAIFPMVALIVSFVLAMWYARFLHLPQAFGGAVAIGFGYAMSGILRWLRSLSPAHSKLKPYVETYSLLLYVAIIAALIARFGILWTGV